MRSEELRKSESAFLLAWLGLGAIILVEGIVLAASGGFDSSHLPLPFMHFEIHCSYLLLIIVSVSSLLVYQRQNLKA